MLFDPFQLPFMQQNAPNAVSPTQDLSIFQKAALALQPDQQNAVVSQTPMQPNGLLGMFQRQPWEQSNQYEAHQRQIGRRPELANDPRFQARWDRRKQNYMNGPLGGMGGGGNALAPAPVVPDTQIPPYASPTAYPLYGKLWGDA
jgi:hypothetical protein